MEADIPRRYQEKPLLVFLENYVLDAVGQLPAEKSKLMGEVIRQTWGGGVDWRATLRKQFDLPRETDEELCGLWRQLQGKIDPEDFARHVVDQRFADLTEEQE